MQDRDGTPLTRYDIKLGGEVDLRGANLEGAVGVQ